MSSVPFQLGKLLIVTGVLLVALGLLLMAGSRFSLFGLGRLPGDIAYRGKNLTFYFPIVTCIILSVAFTLLLWLIFFFSRR